MKVAQRLMMLTAVASAGLLIVSAVGIHSVRSIRADALHLTTEVTPALNAVTRMDAATERVIVNLLNLLKADDPDTIRTLESQLASESGRLLALAQEARQIDPDLSFDTGALSSLGERVSSLAKGQADSNKRFDQQFDNTQASLARAIDEIGKFQDRLRELNEQAREQMSQARMATTELVEAQRNGMALVVGLKEVQAILFELEAVDNRFKVGPLRERFAAALQDIERVTGDPERMKRLTEAAPDVAQIRTAFLAENSGLFDFKASLAKDDREALRQYRSMALQANRSLKAGVRKLSTHVDGLEIEIVRENARVDEALKVTDDPNAWGAAGNELKASAGALVSTLNGLRSATDAVGAAAMTDSAKSVIAGIQDKTRQLGTSIDAAEQPVLHATLAPIAAAIDEVSGNVDRILQGAQEVLALKQDQVLLDREINRTADAQRQATQVIGARVQALLDQTVANANRQAATALQLIILIAGAAVLGLVVFSFHSIRLISRRLNNAVQVAERVASGNLTSVETVGGNDEIAELLKSLSRMVDTLGKAVGRIRRTADGLRNGVAEISTGNNELSDRTNQQASSLHQTSVAIDHVSNTAAHGAKSAREASQLSLGTNQVARDGSLVMNQAVAMMQQVREGAEKISEIISVIDGIAFQTNILALNAAVEAARAGEQGRGFAVVAAEVRGLAIKSADAARQINQIISTNVEHVQEGATLVARAGDAIERIVAEVTRTGTLIQQLADGSNEQSAAVGQVNQAIGFLGESTQQNAALSEQTSAASMHLVAQAEALEEAVQVFSIEEARA